MSRVSLLIIDEIGCLPFERQGDDVLAHTPTPLRNLGQHHFGDERQIQPACIGDGQPAQMAQFVLGPAEIVEIGAYAARIGQEKAGIEPARPPWRRDSLMTSDIHIGGEEETR